MNPIAEKLREAARRYSSGEIYRITERGANEIANEIERLESELAQSQDRFRYREAKIERLERELKESRDLAGQAIAMLESIPPGCSQVTEAIDMMKIAVNTKP